MYSSCAYLSIIFLVFFQTSCDREQIPGEIGSQQLRSIEFPNQGMRLDFLYDDQDTLLRMEGQRPGEAPYAIEISYDPGLIESLSLWRITSDTEEYLEGTLSWYRFPENGGISMNVYPYDLFWPDLNGDWFLSDRDPMANPGYVLWFAASSRKKMELQWDPQTNILTGIDSTAIRQPAGINPLYLYHASDTVIQYTFDQNHNPLQYSIPGKNLNEFIRSAMPHNLISIDTIFPDQSVNSFVRAIEYDNQNRPVVISYEQDGEMIREEWTSRR